MRKSFFHLKIPTFFGLFLTFCLLFTITLSLPSTHPLKGQVLSLTKENIEIIEPENIKVTNLSSNKAQITWQTKTPTIGKISLGETLPQIIPDHRSPDKSYYTHIVVLEKLAAETEYSFKIINNDYVFHKIFTLKTTKPDSTTHAPSIYGKVLTTDLNPLTDGLVFINVGDQLFSTFLTKDGNFILPLKNSPSDQIESFLQVISSTDQSELKISLTSSNGHLPPIVLGQNYDFTNFKNNNLDSQIEKKEVNIYDLNTDGKVNIIDLAILTKNLNKSPIEETFDLNRDKQFDQKDIDLLKSQL